MAGPACPPSQDWALLAAGLMKEAKAQRMLAHLGDCESCGQTLRLAAEAIHGESAVEETLHTLPAAHRLELARRLAGETPAAASNVIEMPRRKQAAWIWALGAAAAVTLMVGGWWRTQADAPVEKLLAQAYTERRPTEFRIPGAAMAPIRMDRAAQATFERPSALLEAESRIAQGMKNEPGNARWMRWKARAEMLEFRADEAIGTLTRAAEAQPGDAEVLAELGAAYAQRAERGDEAADRGDWSHALERLSQALRAQPTLAVALYNRALVHEKLSMETEAIADWQAFLALDGGSDWAVEARKRLAAVQEKKNDASKPLAPIGIPGSSPHSN